MRLRTVTMEHRYHRAQEDEEVVEVGGVGEAEVPPALGIANFTGKNLIMARPDA